MSVCSRWLALLPLALRAGFRLSSGGVSGRHPVGAIEVARGAGRPSVVGDAVGLRALGHAPGRLEGGCRVPVRLASGPVTQPVRVVDVLVLIGGKVPAGTSIVGDLRLAARPAAMAEDGRPAGGGASHRWQAADF